MESFFLAETTKYLYLLFDEHNFIHHNNGSVDQQSKPSLSPSCNPGSAGYIFNTEAHPIDVGAIHCCSPSSLTYLPEDLRTRNIFQYSQKLDDDTCKARPFYKRFSVLGAFLEGTDEAPGNS